jgi:hypothetical protein
MTRLSRPAEGADPKALAATGAGAGGATSDGGAGAAGWPSRPGAELARGRRLRRRLAVPIFSGGPDVAVATAVGAAWTGGGGEAAAAVAAAAVAAAGRRPRRRREGGAGVGAGPGGVASAVRGRAACVLRRTLAPTSPSAHSAPSIVWTSTRQTTMAVGAPPTGGRFWVSVQRA